jgi:tetratricopeptide (TPR) repeat protein
MYRGGKSRIYSAQNQVQAIIYSALPAGSEESVEVLDTLWADAYLLKAYALTELKRVPEAQKALESAISLSPMNSQYLSELAYTYQAQKNCDKSVATYEQAASMAELASDDATKTIDLTRAWRGQGYCLVEQGKLNEAEAMYRKCLALDPKDNKARGELEYIQGLRKQ